MTGRRAESTCPVSVPSVARVKMWLIWRSRRRAEQVTLVEAENCSSNSLKTWNWITVGRSDEILEVLGARRDHQLALGRRNGRVASLAMKTKCCSSGHCV